MMSIAVCFLETKCMHDGWSSPILCPCSGMQSCPVQFITVVSVHSNCIYSVIHISAILNYMCRVAVGTLLSVPVKVIFNKSLFILRFIAFPCPVPSGHNTQQHEPHECQERMCKCQQESDCTQILNQILENAVPELQWMLMPHTFELER